MQLNEFTSNYLCPFVIIFGTFGAVFGIIVMCQKNLKKIGPQLVFISMYVFDMFHLVNILDTYASYTYNFDFTGVSNFTCKFYWYYIGSIVALSPMMNVYISVERFISIAYPTRKFFLLKNKIQLIYILFISVFNLLLFIPNGMYFETFIFYNVTYCTVLDPYWHTTLANIDLINRVIVPFVLMGIFSILIIATIFKSRSRMATSSSTDKKQLKKDIKFSVMSISLNIQYIVFSLPISIILRMDNYYMNPYFLFFTVFSYFAYILDFYIMFFMNRVFRQGLLAIFGIDISKKANSRATVNTMG